jgi:hypothetical protein
MTNETKDDLFVTTVVVIVFYGLMVLFTSPMDSYLCEATIEGRELCFHSEDGKSVSYFKNTIGIHKREGFFLNYNETLEDDYEKIAEGYRFYNNLKCE